MDEAVQKLFNATPEELGQAAVLAAFVSSIKAAEKTCTCHWCTVIYPKIKQVSEKLHGEDLKAFDYLIRHYDNMDQDFYYEKCLKEKQFNIIGLCNLIGK